MSNTTYTCLTPQLLHQLCILFYFTTLACPVVWSWVGNVTTTTCQVDGTWSAPTPKCGGSRKLNWDTMRRQKPQSFRFSLFLPHHYLKLHSCHSQNSFIFIKTTSMESVKTPPFQDERWFSLSHRWKVAYTYLLHWDEHRAGAWHRLPFFLGGSGTDCWIMMNRQFFFATAAGGPRIAADRTSWSSCMRLTSFTIFSCPGYVGRRDRSQPGLAGSLRLNHLSYSIR